MTQNYNERDHNRFPIYNFLDTNYVFQLTQKIKTTHKVKAASY